MMYASSSSPFDEALCKPFLGAPAKKKWSLPPILAATVSSGTAATIFSDYFDDDCSSQGDDDSVFSDDYEAPDLGEEVIEFDHDDELVSKNGELELSTMQLVDTDTAILTERHGSFTEMKKSMAQILDIQNDLSALVATQDEDIENLQATSLEAMDQAQAGVKHLMGINQGQEMKQQRQTYLCLAMIMFIGALWTFGSSA